LHHVVVAAVTAFVAVLDLFISFGCGKPPLNLNALFGLIDLYMHRLRELSENDCQILLAFPDATHLQFTLIGWQRRTEISHILAAGLLICLVS
jgi:hypothetical protein